jgi:hypothetical protein
MIYLPENKGFIALGTLAVRPKRRKEGAFYAARAWFEIGVIWYKFVA